MLLNEAKYRAEAHDCVIEFTHYSYCYMETSRGMVSLIHPVNYSVNPVGLAQQLYSTENGPYFDPSDPNSRVDRCHIVVAHTHLQGWGWSKDGTRECHALGTLRDPVRTQYKNKHKSKLPTWIQGFLMVKHGYFYPLNRHSTDWSQFLMGLESQRYEIIESQRIPSRQGGAAAPKLESEWLRGVAGGDICIIDLGATVDEVSICSEVAQAAAWLRAAHLGAHAE